jgi:predicted ArsR family transcriptional regulator
MVALLRRGGRTVEELARAVGLTNNGVRAHLATLERDGIVRQGGTVRPAGGGGKPAYVYELTPEVEGLFPKAYESASAGCLTYFPRDSDRRSRKRCSGGWGAAWPRHEGRRWAECGRGRRRRSRY